MTDTSLVLGGGDDVDAPRSLFTSQSPLSDAGVGASNAPAPVMSTAEANRLLKVH